MSTKFTQADLEERFHSLVEKAERGKCVIPGCETGSELVTYDQSLPPILCYQHQNDGNVTHYGEYQQTENPYYKKWTCCDSTWFNSKCSALTRKFADIASIPVTPQQLQNLHDELERLKQQQEEQERYERMLNAGRDEYYDR